MKTEQDVAPQPPAPGIVGPTHLSLIDILNFVAERNASDLHLVAGGQPFVRLNGDLLRLENYPKLTPDNVQDLIYSILSERQQERLEEELELDISYSIPGKARFRVNCYYQRDSLAAAFRLIPFELKTIAELGLPKHVAALMKTTGWSLALINESIQPKWMRRDRSATLDLKPRNCGKRRLSSPLLDARFQGKSVRVCA